MSRTLRPFAHSMISVQVHFVFVTKYRHRVITEQIEDEVKTLVAGICDKNRCILLEGKADLGERDHIHLLIDMAPNSSISVLANTLKTVTSREIRKRHAEYLAPFYWKPYFWKRGYCAVSAGDASLDTLVKYIKAQGEG